MLGAQALRTKQKVEQKEKEKRQKERVRKLELQRERIQKVAHEDAQAMIEAATNQMQYLQLQNNKPVQRHYSLHAHAIQDQLRPMVREDSPSKDNQRAHITRRSPSSDFGRNQINHQNIEIQNGGGNRFMKWLGFSNANSQKKAGCSGRRMSTY